MLLRQGRTRQARHGKPPPAPLAPSRPAATVLINTTRNRRPLPDPQAHEGHNNPSPMPKDNHHGQSHGRTGVTEWAGARSRQCHVAVHVSIHDRRQPCACHRYGSAENPRLGPRLGPIVVARAIGTATMCKHHADVNGIRTHRSRTEI